MDSLNKKYKFLIVGDRKVGKTAYSTRLYEGRFLSQYEASIGCVINFTRDPNEEEEEKKVVFHIWDCPGDKKCENLPMYFKDADGAIVIFDVTSQSSYKNVRTWISKLNKVGIYNIVVCGNKVDSRERVVMPRNIKIKYQYYELSTKSGYNIGKPFVPLLKNVCTQEKVCK